MSITIAVDGDVAARLKGLVDERRQPMRVVVNEVLRVGLTAFERPQPFRTAGFDLGPSLIGSLDDVQDVLARIDRG